MKDKIALLRKADNLSEEQKSALNDLEQFIQTAETDKSKVEDLQIQLNDSDLKLRTALRDTMEYKDRVKKAEGHLDTRDETIKELEGKVKDYDSLTAENENLKSLKVEQDKGLRAKYEKMIKELEKKPTFDKIKDKLVLPTDETKLDDIPIEEINKSLAKIQEWTDAGFLTIPDGKSTGEAGENALDDEAELNRINKMRKSMRLPPLKKLKKE